MPNTSTAEPEYSPPFGPRGLLILISLASGDKHGYALMQDIEEFAGVKLGPGTLYGAVRALQEDGFVKALRHDGRRRPYRITPAGMRAATAVLEQEAQLARVGQRRLRRRPAFTDDARPAN